MEPDHFTRPSEENESENCVVVCSCIISICNKIYKLQCDSRPKNKVTLNHKLMKPLLSC